MKCPICDKNTVITDWPSRKIYHLEDTEWGFHPTKTHNLHDPKILIAKSGTRPAVCCTHRGKD